MPSLPLKSLPDYIGPSTLNTWSKPQFPFDKREIQAGEKMQSACCTPSVFPKELTARKTNFIALPVLAKTNTLLARSKMPRPFDIPIKV